MKGRLARGFTGVFLGALLGSLALFAPPSIAAANGSIEVGRPFPPLLLPDAATGAARSLAEFRGRKVVLHVFASW